MNAPRILPADAHPLVLTVLCQLASRVGTVVSLVSSGLVAVEESRCCKPNVVVLDLGMPGIGGIKAAELLHRDLQNTKVIICTGHTDMDYVARAFAAGAVGFVRKQSAHKDLVPAMCAALPGERFVSPSLHQNGLHTHEYGATGSHS